MRIVTLYGLLMIAIAIDKDLLTDSRYVAAIAALAMATALDLEELLRRRLKKWRF